MTAIESIGNARARLAEARESLLKVTPESLDHCRGILGDVAQLLRDLISDNAGGLTPEVVSVAREIQHVAQELQSQMEYGSRFCLGWMQMRMSVGYSDRGVPILIETEGRSFEL